MNDQVVQNNVWENYGAWKKRWESLKERITHLCSSIEYLKTLEQRDDGTSNELGKFIPSEQENLNSLAENLEGTNIHLTGEILMLQYVALQFIAL